MRYRVKKVKQFFRFSIKNLNGFKYNPSTHIVNNQRTDLGKISSIFLINFALNFEILHFVLKNWGPKTYYDKSVSEVSGGYEHHFSVPGL